jgi:hypothetical protein
MLRREGVNGTQCSFSDRGDEMRGSLPSLVVAMALLTRWESFLLGQAPDSAAVAPAKPVGRSIAGKITKFDLATNALTVTVGKGDETFTVEPTTVIRNGVKRIAAGDLPALVGHQVRVRYSELNGSRSLGAVLVSPAPTTDPTKPQN